MPGERGSLWARWAAKVDMSGGLLACWPWKGAKSTKRRGRRGAIQIGGRGSRVVSAARVALALATDGEYDKRGPDGELLEVLHKCHNGGNEIDCVNPAHLDWGTRAENLEDVKANRGNHRRKYRESLAAGAAAACGQSPAEGMPAAWKD